MKNRSLSARLFSAPLLATLLLTSFGAAAQSHRGWSAFGQLDHWADVRPSALELTLLEAPLEARPAARFAAAEEAEAPTLAVWPNPSRDVVTVTGAAGHFVRLYDGLGRLVRTLPGAAETRLDLADLPRGVYVLRCGARTQRVVVE